jgi:hypothetical protein
MDKKDLPVMAPTENKEEDHFGRRNYDENGNGWSRYQIMVLQQLTDHTKLLQALMSEINTIKQQIAITDIVSKNWRDQADRSIQELKDDVEFILEDEGGINQRLKSIEDNTKIEEKSSLKIKAFWGLLGGAVVVIIDVTIRVVSLIGSKLQVIMQNPPQ